MSLLGTSALSAMQTAFKILAGFILVKAVALAAGPDGVARLGQFQNLVTIISILSGGMFYTGVTKLVAEHEADTSKAVVVVQTTLRICLISFFCVAVIMAVLRDEIAVGILKDAGLSGFVMALPWLAFFTTLYGLWLAFLNGLGKVRALVTLSIASSAIMMLLTVALAPSFGLVGAYVAMLAPPAIVLVSIFIKRFLKLELPQFFLCTRENLSRYRELWKFALMGLVSAVAAPVAQMVMREYLVDTLSLEQAGIWQGVTRISEVYMVFITSSLSVYFLPKLAQANNRSEISNLVVSVLKLVVPISVFLGCIIYICRDLLIWLLFTTEFSSMRDLFFWQVAGDLIKIVSWVFAYIVMVKGNALIFIVGEVVFNVTYPLFGFLITPLLGLKGAVAAYGVNYLFYLAFMLGVFYLIKKSWSLND